MTNIMDLPEKIRRPIGLCANIMYTDEKNASIIRFIMDAYLQGTSLQRASRTEDVWEAVMDLPSNFDSYRYRVSQ